MSGGLSGRYLSSFSCEIYVLGNDYSFNPKYMVLLMRDSIYLSPEKIS
jgi:hypothetical protein